MRGTKGWGRNFAFFHPPMFNQTSLGHSCTYRHEEVKDSPSGLIQAVAGCQVEDLIAVGGGKSKVWILDSSSRVLSSFGVSGWVNSIQWGFGDDSMRLLVSSEESLAVHETSGEISVILSPSATRFATWTASGVVYYNDESVFVWKRKEDGTWGKLTSFHVGANIRALAVNGACGAEIIALILQSGEVSLFSLHSMSEKCRIRTGLASQCIALNRDGMCLAVSGPSGTIKVWHLGEASSYTLQTHTLSMHDSVRSLLFSPHITYLLAIQCSSLSTLIDLERGVRLPRYTSLGSVAPTLSWGFRGRSLYAWSNQNKLETAFLDEEEGAGGAGGGGGEGGGGEGEGVMVEGDEEEDARSVALTVSSATSTLSARSVPTVSPRSRSSSRDSAASARHFPGHHDDGDDARSHSSGSTLVLLRRLEEAERRAEDAEFCLRAELEQVKRLQEERDEWKRRAEKMQEERKAVSTIPL